MSLNKGITMYDNAYLILIYNKEVLQSKTFLSLISIDCSNHNSVVIIWNNGPNHIDVDSCKEKLSEYYSVEVIETLDNIGLADIYNKFIARFRAKRYVILDDDTVLNREYLSSIDVVEIDESATPIIYHGELRVEPVINGKIYKGPPTCLIEDAEKITSIASGLVIGSGFAKQVQSQFGKVFDERFILYGVDASFFHRINHMNLAHKFKILPPLTHSLSRLENESEQMTRFRVIERANAHALLTRYYRPFLFAWRSVITSILKYSVKRILNIEDDLHLKWYIVAFIRGKHYRSKSYK